MRSKVSFGNSAIRSIFPTAILMMLAQFVFVMSSAMIAGNVVGEEALSAVNLVAPLYNYAVFFAGIIAIGSGFLYFRYLGAYDKQRADEIFGQSIILALILGLLIFTAMLVGKNAYLDSLGISETVRAEAEAFWKYEKYFLMITPLDFLLFELLYTDISLCLLADMAFIVGGTGAAYILATIYGTAGISMGMVVGIVISDIVLVQHFFSKKNIFSFKWHVKWNDIKEMCRLSLVDASTYLDSAILIMFINSYVIRNYSESMLPVTAIMITTLDMVIVFDSVGCAMSPVAEVYLGEGNNHDEKSVAKYSLYVAATLGIIATILVMIFAPWISRLFGLMDPAQIEKTAEILRLFAPALPFYSVAYILISQFIAVRQIVVAVIYEWTKTLILPLICILIFGGIFGFNGIWMAFAPAEILATVGFSLGIRLFVGKEKSIWLLENEKYSTFSRSYRIDDNCTKAVVEDIEKFLTKNEVSKGISSKITLVMEEMTNLLTEHNIGRKVIVQYTVSIRDDGIYLFERDNGALYNPTDLDMKISEFRDYVFSRAIDTCNKKQYLIALNYNHSVFCFK